MKTEIVRLPIAFKKAIYLPLGLLICFNIVKAAPNDIVRPKKLEGLEKYLAIVEVSGDRRTIKVLRDAMHGKALAFVSAIAAQENIHGNLDSLYFVSRLHPLAFQCVRIKDGSVRLRNDGKWIVVPVDDIEQECERLSATRSSLGQPKTKDKPREK